MKWLIGRVFYTLLAIFSLVIMAIYNLKRVNKC